MKLKVYGASDDLIEIEGDWMGEFSYFDEDAYLGFSDGTVFVIHYSGIWCINVLHRGAAQITKTPAETEESDRYTDIIEIEGDLKWLMCCGAGDDDGFYEELTKR